MEWDANGLLQDQQELQAVLDIESIDLMSYYTHFTNESFIRFQGYKTCHTINPKNPAREGSEVIIGEAIMHHQAFGYRTED